MNPSNEPVGKNLFGQASSVVFCRCWLIECSCKASPRCCDEIHPPTPHQMNIWWLRVRFLTHTRKSYKMMIFHIYSIKSGYKLVQPIKLDKNQRMEWERSRIHLPQTPPKMKNLKQSGRFQQYSCIRKSSRQSSSDSPGAGNITRDER